MNKRLYKQLRFDSCNPLINRTSALQMFNIIHTIDEFKRDMSHIDKDNFVSELQALTRLFQTAVLTGNMNEDFIENYINALSDEYDYYFVDKTSHRLIQRKKESIFYVYYRAEKCYNQFR